MTDLIEYTARERHNRLGKKKRGQPMRWYLESGADRPEVEHWCDYCVAFYGVPHTHVDQYGSERSCPFLSRAMNGDRQCACIDCVCAEKVYGEGSLLSRITQA